jgi:hypothetical protein
MTHLVAALLILPGSTAQAKPAITFATTKAGVKGKWTASTRLPKLSGSDLARLAQAAIEKAEMRVYSEFVKEAKAFYRSPEYASNSWGYESDIEAKLMTGNLLSFLGSSYQYSGGAHGIGLKRTYNFGFVKGKAKLLTLDDVLSGTSARRELSLRLLEKAMQTPGTDWIEGGEVKDFTRQQLDRFWIAADGLVFEFDPYELGSYASGPFSFTLKWGELKGLLNSKGPLGRFTR